MLLHRSAISAYYQTRQGETVPLCEPLVDGEGRSRPGSQQEADGYSLLLDNTMLQTLRCQQATLERSPQARPSPTAKAPGKRLLQKGPTEREGPWIMG